MNATDFTTADDVIEHAIFKGHVTLRLPGWELEQVPEKVREIKNLEFLDLRKNRISILPEWLKLEPDFEDDDYILGKVLLKGNLFTPPPPTTTNIEELTKIKINPTFGITNFLNEKKPEGYKWDSTENLVSISEFETDCLEIFQRTIKTLKDGNTGVEAINIWKTGAKLVDGDSLSEIMVLEGMRKLRIRTSGENARSFLVNILDLLCDTIEKMGIENFQLGFPGHCIEKNKCFETMSPCFNFWNLRRYRQEKKHEIECQKSISKVQIHELLNLPRFTFRVYISYSNEDEVYRENLRKYLSPLEDELIIWDCSELKGGDETEKVSQTQLSKSDVILYLISSNFLANKKLERKEVKEKLHQFGRTILAIPIIAEPCLWDSVDCWKNLKPANDTPVSKSHNEAESWTEISKNILQAVRDWQKTH